MPSIILTYSPPDGSADLSITIRSPQYGNRDVLDPTQEVLRSQGQALYVYNRGPRRRQFVYRFEALDQDERADVENFFDEANADLAMRWFTLTVSSPTHREILRAGALVDGSAILAGSTYTAGDRILMDSLKYRVSLVSPVLDWDEFTDGYWNLELTLEVIDDLPSNAC